MQSRRGNNQRPILQRHNDLRGWHRAGSEVAGNFILDLPAQVETGAGDSLGISFASISSSFLDVHLSTLEASGHGEVISRPRIATLDNTEA